MSKTNKLICNDCGKVWIDNAFPEEIDCHFCGSNKIELVVECKWCGRQAKESAIEKPADYCHHDIIK